ncbi:MAG: TlpA family protein disulfide reductase [Deltaproteobacteria bacterium]|nr:TlpA family protein disulfide reductase [Deltaproteobacteria bacterium]
MSKSMWGSLVLPAVLLLPAGWGCNGDDSVEPDAGNEATDGPVDSVPDDAFGDEPVGPEGYPPAPYGVTVGDRMQNLRFTSIDGSALELADFYADHTVKLLWIFASAGWCTACAAQSTAMPGIYDEYHPQGLEILGTVFEDGSAAPASAAYARGYATRYGWNFPGAADETFELGRYFDKSATPLNMLVDLTDMTIMVLETGWGEAAFRSAIESNLAAIADRAP